MEPHSHEREQAKNRAKLLEILKRRKGLTKTQIRGIMEQGLTAKKKQKLRKRK